MGFEHVDGTKSMMEGLEENHWYWRLFRDSVVNEFGVWDRNYGQQGGA